MELSEEAQLRLKMLELVSHSNPNWKSKWVIKKAKEYFDFVREGKTPIEDGD